MPVSEAIKAMVGCMVVVDTDSHLVYIGKLVETGSDCIALADVDVHSNSDTHSSREIYLMDARKYGVRHNRTNTVILLSRIVSISKLDDVADY